MTVELQDSPDLRNILAHLYNGRSERAERFRYGLIVFDIAVLAYFILSSALPPSPWLLAIDGVVGMAMIADYGARFWIAKRKVQFALEPLNLIDLVVIATLIAGPFVENWTFLRVLRSLRLLRSHRVLADLRKQVRFFRRHRELIAAMVNLGVFLFTITALVYMLQHRSNPEIGSYIDALYFTVTTLTTTGFGDITMKDEAGRLLAVVIMIVGFALFVRLIQAVFRPEKVRFRCPDCGLLRHDHDAVHCKHCGRILPIPDEGT
jgi:voltage-gated potassium channel